MCCKFRGGKVKRLIYKKKEHEKFKKYSSSKGLLFWKVVIRYYKF